jgi:putative transposase
VHKAFSRWAARGAFEQLHDRLRAQWRERLGKHALPSAAILDSQSTRISPQGGASGYDAGKKVKGRKRHLLVDTLGLLLSVVVTAASVQDRDGAVPSVATACQQYPSLPKRYVDGAYAGGCAALLRSAHGLDVEVVRHPGNGNVGCWHLAQVDLFDTAPPTGFVVLPKRWVVERTHAWTERSRRLIMHHDRAVSTAVAWVWLAEARMLARRLTT